MQSQSFVIDIVGADEDRQALRLRSLFRFLRSVEEVLNAIDQDLTDSDRPSVCYQVVRMSQSSPATLEIAAMPIDGRPDIAASIVDRFFLGLRAIIDRDTDVVASSRILEPYKAIGLKPAYNFKQIGFRRNGTSIQVTRDLTQDVDDVLGPVLAEGGSLTGRLEAINIHGKKRFTIYPTVGPRSVSCEFSESILGAAVSAFGRYVAVHGELKYRRRDNFPHGIDAREIEVYPCANDLPSLFDIRGMLEGVPLRGKSEDIVRHLRDTA